jgi:hypothetical protein
MPSRSERYDEEENIVAVEHACTGFLSKPWTMPGLTALSEIPPNGIAIGEVLFRGLPACSSVCSTEVRS